MNKILYILYCLAIISCNLKKGGNKAYSDFNYSILAKIEGIEDSTKVVIFNAEKFKPIDSCIVINNQFTFKGNIQEPQPAFFFFLSDSGIIYPRFYFWMDKSDITINANVQNLNTRNLQYFTKEQIKGSILNSLFSDYHNKTKDILKKKGKGKLDNEIMNFVFSKPNNFLSLSIVFKNSKGIFKDSLKSYYNIIDSLHRNTSYGMAIKKLITTRKLKKGDYFIDIIANDLDGNLIKLSNFKNKVILLDFWSSSCAPCRMQIKDKFSKLKKKYADEDFLIVNFSLDTNYKAWEKASKEDGINWINISDLNGHKSEAVINYNVRSIPRTFLIDKNGVIRNLNIGYTEENNTIEKEIDKIIIEQ